MMSDRQTLKYWEKKARQAISKWLNDVEYRYKICPNYGSYTEFLYHFAQECNCGWGVMIDFHDRKQRVILVNEYYQWMHRLRDEIEVELEKINKQISE